MIKVSSDYEANLEKLLNKELGVTFEEKPARKGKYYINSCLISIKENMLIVKDNTFTVFFS